MPEKFESLGLWVLLALAAPGCAIQTEAAAEADMKAAYAAAPVSGGSSASQRYLGVLQARVTDTCACAASDTECIRAATRHDDAIRQLQPQVWDTLEAEQQAWATEAYRAFAACQAGEQAPALGPAPGASGGPAHSHGGEDEPRDPAPAVSPEEAERRRALGR